MAKIAADGEHIVKISKISGNKIYGFDIITEKMAVLNRSESVLDPEWLSKGIFKKKTMALIVQILREDNKSNSLFDMFSFNKRTYKRYLRDKCNMNAVEDWKDVFISDNLGNIYEITEKINNIFCVKVKRLDKNTPSHSSFFEKDGVLCINESQLNESVDEGILEIIDNKRGSS